MNQKKKDIIFFGNFSEVLFTLEKTHSIKQVICEQNKVPQEIENFCKVKAISLLKIKALSDFFLEYATDPNTYAVSAGFGLLFKASQIKSFRAIYNFHPGSVYTNRGRHPLPNAILQGHKTMTLTVHQIIDESIDTGMLVSFTTFPIDYKRSYQYNCDRLLSGLNFLAQDLSNRLLEDWQPTLPIYPEKLSYFAALPSNKLDAICSAKELGLFQK